MKNKVVFFPKNGTPRLYSTQSPDTLVKDLKDGISLINPNLSLVQGIPPELWTLDGEKKIIPLQGANLEQKMAERDITGLLTEKDEKIKENIHNLVNIPDEFKTLCAKLDDQFELNQKAFRSAGIVAVAKLDTLAEQANNSLKASILDMKNYIQNTERSNIKRNAVLLAVLGLILILEALSLLL